MRPEYPSINFLESVCRRALYRFPEYAEILVRLEKTAEPDRHPLFLQDLPDASWRLNLCLPELVEWPQEMENTLTELIPTFLDHWAACLLSPTEPDSRTLVLLQESLAQCLLPLYTVLAANAPGKVPAVAESADHLMQAWAKMRRDRSGARLRILWQRARIRLNSNLSRRFPVLAGTETTEAVGDAPSRAPWPLFLQNYLYGLQQSHLRPRMSRPSKRYGSFPGVRVASDPRVLVALDTSGSIAAEDLNRFFSEIGRLSVYLPRIRLVQCDDRIREIQWFRPGGSYRATGRGGTDFDPVLEYFENSADDPLLVYFTDGKGPVPKIRISKPVLWVISVDGIDEKNYIWNQLPGRRYKLNPS